nr:endonuclease/exonuclease/phosphatase family protein [Ipomoea batatas]
MLTLSSWNLLRYLSSVSSFAWVVTQDFNDLFDPSDKIGRVPHPVHLLNGFRDAIRESGLFDSLSSGCPFT